MANDLGVKIGVSGENEFKKAIRDINAQFKELASEMNLATSAFDKNDDSVEALAAQNQVLNKQIDAQVGKIETLKKALENASASFGENDKRTQAWKTQLNNAQAELNGMRRTLDTNNKKISDTGDSFNNAEKDVKKFADETDKAADKTKKSGDKFAALGDTLKAVGAAISAAVTAVGVGVGAVVSKINDCVDVYSNFDDSMRQVAATMGMSADEIVKTGGEFEMLEKAAEKAGSTTKFSASQAADALNYLALAGYDAEKAATTLPKVLDLAAAGGMDLATASDLVTDSMSALGLETKDIDTFMDQMAKASQKSNTSVQQLGEATLVCAGAISNTGQSLNTMNTALGVLADNGIKGAEGGTHLRNAILSLSTPTDKAADRLKALGVSVYDSKGSMRDLNAIMTDLNRKLGTMSQDAQNSALSDIFNKTDLTAVNALLGATTGRFSELSGLISDSKGAASEMAKTMESGLAGAQRSFGSALEGVQIQVGKVFEALKENALGSATDIMNSFSNALSEAGGDWNKIGDAVGGAISGIVGMVSDYLPQITDMGIKVITALLKGISENKDSLANTAKELVNNLSAALVEFLPQFAESASDILSAIVGGLMDNLSAITGAALQVVTTIANGIGESLPELIPTVVDVVLQIVDTLLDHIDELVDAGLKIIEGLIDGIAKAIPKITKKIPEIITKIVSALTKALPKILECGVKILEELLSGITKALPEITKELPKIITAIVNFIMGAIPQIIQVGIQLFSALVDNIDDILTPIVDMLPELIDGIVDGILGEGNLEKIIQAGIELFETLVTNIPQIVEKIAIKIPEIVTGIGEKIAENGSKLFEKGKELFSHLCENPDEIIMSIKDKIEEIINGILDFFKDFGEKMFNVGKEAAQRFTDGLKNISPAAIFERAKEGEKVLNEIAADPQGFAERIKAAQSGAGVFTGSGFNNFKSALRDTSSSVKATAADTTRSGGAYGPKIENDVSSSVNINMYVDGQKTSSTQYSRLKDGETVGCYINNGKGR